MRSTAERRKLILEYISDRRFVKMQEIADETGKSIEDVFILYMDLASEASVEAENNLQAVLEEDEEADFSSIANRIN